jgi:H/ACA ribonucleoprotein complex subunit 1
MGPPDTVLGQSDVFFFLLKAIKTVDIDLGTFVHAVEDEMLCASTLDAKVPYFNAPVYLPNKAVIGKVDEILGPINEVYFTVKMGEGMVASSFKKGDKVCVGPDKLLPLERFLPKPKIAGKIESEILLNPCLSHY